MGASQGKNIHPEDYEVVSDDGEDIELSVEAEDEVVPEADEVPETEQLQAEEEVKIEEAPQSKKKKRRNRRGKKVVEGVKPESDPEPENTPIVETIETVPIDIPKKKKEKPTAIPKEEPKPKLTKAEIHELAKQEQIALNRTSSIKEADRTCFACKNVCESRFQLNHHYGICGAFPGAYEKLTPKERSWYMIIQYVRNDLAKASRICLGCGCVFQTRHLLLAHTPKCEKAMTIDTWDRITCFGLLYGTPYDDFAKFLPKYKEPKKIPDYVKRVHEFVESLKKTILREKAEARLADERMKVVEEEHIQKYIKEKMKGDGVWTVKQAESKQASAKEPESKQVSAKQVEAEPVHKIAQEPLPQTPKKERKRKETRSTKVKSEAEPEVEQEPKAEQKPKAEPEPIVLIAEAAVPSEYIETCNCEHCDLVRTYPPLENPALRGAEREGYYIIPMVMDGYSTVVNNRRIYVPTQNVLLRIHDLGLAP